MSAAVRLEAGRLAFALQTDMDDQKLPEAWRTALPAPSSPHALLPGDMPGTVVGQAEWNGPAFAKLLARLPLEGETRKAFDAARLMLLGKGDLPALLGQTGPRLAFAFDWRSGVPEGVVVLELRDDADPRPWSEAVREAGNMLLAAMALDQVSKHGKAVSVQATTKEGVRSVTLRGLSGLEPTFAALPGKLALGTSPVWVAAAARTATAPDGGAGLRLDGVLLARAADHPQFAKEAPQPWRGMLQAAIKRIAKVTGSATATGGVRRWELAAHAAP
jgi:hypothetical protein